MLRWAAITRLTTSLTKWKAAITVWLWLNMLIISALICVRFFACNGTSHKVKPERAVQDDLLVAIEIGLKHIAHERIDKNQRADRDTRYDKDPVFDLLQKIIKFFNHKPPLSV